MTESDDRLARMLGKRADRADLPAGLAALARRRAVRRRGAFAGVAAAVLVAGVAVTSIALGRPSPEAGPTTPVVGPVDVCRGDTSGSSPAASVLRASGDSEVVVCRTWPFPVMATRALGAPTATLLTDDEADRLLDVLASGTPSSDDCVVSGVPGPPTDRVVIDPGPDQASVEIDFGLCQSYELNGLRYLEAAGLRPLLDAIADRGERVPSDEAAACGSTEPSPANRDQVLAADPDRVVVCRFDNHAPEMGGATEPPTLEASALLDRSDGERLLDLVAAGRRAPSPCMMIDSIPARSDLLVLDVDGTRRTVRFDSPSCLGYRLGDETLQSPEAQGLLGQLLATAAADEAPSGAAQTCDATPVALTASVDDVAGEVESVVVCHKPVDPDAQGWARSLASEEVDRLAPLLVEAGEPVDCDTQPIADNRVLITDGNGDVRQVVLPEPGCLGYELGGTRMTPNDELQALVASWSDDPRGHGAVAWTQNPDRAVTGPGITEVRLDRVLEGDPAAGVPHPLTLRIHEVECTSGRDPGPFLRTPYVVETSSSVTVWWTSDYSLGSADCQGNPSVTRTIALDEPLGDRTVIDGFGDSGQGKRVNTYVVAVDDYYAFHVDPAARCTETAADADGPAPTQPMFDTHVGEVVVCHEPGRAGGPSWARTLTDREAEDLFAAVGEGVGAPGCESGAPAATNRVVFGYEGADALFQVVLEEPGCRFYAVGDTFVAQSARLRSLVAGWSDDPFGQGALPWG